jgi:putative ABC transport system permease protein
VSLWRQLARGLHALMHRESVDREVAEEVAQYFDDSVAAHMADGLSPEAARRAARVDFGSPMVVREQVRSSGWEHAIETVLADLRYGVRQIVAVPGFTTVTVFILALGIGASTSIFSAAKPILFSLPYRDADRLVTLWDSGPDGSRLDVTFGTFRELQARSRSFDAMAVVRPWQPSIAGDGEAERLDGQRVSARYFDVLGVTPALGRRFDDADDRPGAPAIAIISDGFWRRRFGADPTIVGQRLLLDGEPHLVVGVMPGSFENVLAPPAAIWRPLQYDPALTSFEGREWGHHLRLVARLRAGVAIDRARGEIDAIARGPVPQFVRPRWASLGGGLAINPLQDDVARGMRGALVAVIGAVMLLLVSVCVNVSNLILGRGARRQGEFAMRLALGAGRGRLVRQLMTESLLLSALGGGLGVLAATVGVRALVAVSPAGLPRISQIRVDGNVLIFALGLTLVVGVLVALLPALHGSGSASFRNIPLASRHRALRRLTHRALVVTEVALALVLLAGAGLLWRSFQNLFALRPGFATTSLLTMQVQVAGRRFDNDATNQFFARALDEVRRVPGVVAAAFTSQLPLSGDSDTYGVHFEASPTQDAEADHGAFRYAIDPDYFDTMGIPQRAGRRLDASDRANAPLAAVISESFARRRFPGQDAVGQRLHIGANQGPWYTVVGIVGDVKQTSLTAGQTDAVYVTAAQWRFADRARWLVVRSAMNAAALGSAVRMRVRSVDKDQPIVRVATMDALLAASAAERRFALILFNVFGLAALVLAATGIYGVLAADVAERAREIGIRSALGATRAAIVGVVVRQGLLLTALGIMLGMAGAAAASRAIVSMLFGVSPFDPLTYIAITVTLLCVSALACSVPACRAALVDPAITLRAE